MINKFSSALLEEFIKPIQVSIVKPTSKDRLSLLNKVKTIERVLSQLITVGDTYHYIEKLISSKNNSNSRYNNLGFLSLEEVFYSIKDTFSHGQSELSDVSALLIDHNYSSYELMSFTHNYHIQHGITVANTGTEFINGQKTENGLILKGDFSIQGEYPNISDDNYLTVHYHLMTSSSRFPNFDSPIHQKILLNNLPIYLFKSEKKNNQIASHKLLGMYKCVGISDIHPETHVKLIKI